MVHPSARGRDRSTEEAELSKGRTRGTVVSQAPKNTSTREFVQVRAGRAARLLILHISTKMPTFYQKVTQPCFLPKFYQIVLPVVYQKFTEHLAKHCLPIFSPQISSTYLAKIW